MIGRIAIGARRHAITGAVAISAAISIAYLLWQPHALDLAAQTFRADLFSDHGWVTWSPDWYGGHTIPGYSLLYPPLASWLSPALLGALCTVASALLFGLIARHAYGDDAWLGTLWFGLGSGVALYGGRLTFGLGVAFGLAAVLAIQRRRPFWAAVAAVAATFSSPVAGLFVGLGAAGVLGAALLPLDGDRRMDLPWKQALAAGLAAAVAIAVLTQAFPTEGYQPFTLRAWYSIPLTVVAVLLLVPKSEVILRWIAVLYALGATAALFIDTPLGGNVVRFAATFGGPVLALALIRRERLALLILALPLLYWQWTATIRDVAAAQGEPSTTAAFFAPLVEELGDQAGERIVRVHVPPTRSRWESVYVAERFPLARGWLRQLEADDFELFQDQNLTPARYNSWLHDHGVSYVALPVETPRDYLAVDEVRLIRGGLGFLSEVWRNPDWELYRVTGEDPERLIDGPGVITNLEPDGFTVKPGRPGGMLVRVSWSPYFEVTSGDACVRELDGWTRLRAESTKPVRVEAHFTLSGLLRTTRECSE